MKRLLFAALILSVLVIGPAVAQDGDSVEAIITSALQASADAGTTQTLVAT